MEETTAQTFRGVVTPRPLLPDEISAIVLLEKLQGSPVSEIQFSAHSNYSPEQVDALLEQGLFPIELGEMSYKANGTGSATESLVKTLGLNPTDLNAGEGILLELLARRNRDGYMNQFKMSMPRILGNLYDLGYDEMELVERFKDVVCFFLDAENRKARAEAPARTDVSMSDELSDLVEATKQCAFAPFTPGRYLRDMWRCGEPIDQIHEKVSFWVNAWNRFQEEYAKAKTEWSKMDKMNFSINGLSGTAIETDNRFMAKVGAPTADIFINRRLDGHGAVMTRGRDVSILNQELQRLEPGKWYYHKPAGHLINGSSSPASELSLDQFVELAKNFPPK